MGSILGVSLPTRQCRLQTYIVLLAGFSTDNAPRFSNPHPPTFHSETTRIAEAGSLPRYASPSPRISRRLSFLPPSVYHRLWTQARLEHSYVSIIRYTQRSRFAMSHTAEGSVEGHSMPGPQLNKGGKGSNCDRISANDASGMNEARFIHTEYVTFVLHFSTFSSLTILLGEKCYGCIFGIN